MNEIDVTYKFNWDAVKLTEQADQKLIDGNARLAWITDSSLRPQEMLTLSHQNEPMGTLTIYNNGEMCVEVNLATGDIKTGDNYTPTKAAQLFWEAIGDVQSSAASQLAECRDLLAGFHKALDETREVLNVRPDDSIVETAHIRMDHIAWLRRRVDELGLEVLNLKGISPGDFVLKKNINVPAQDCQSKMNFDDAMKVAKDL